MKKFIAAIATLSLAVACFAGCASNTTPSDSDATNEPEATATAAPDYDVNYKDDGVMTYAEYAAAELDSQVVIEAFIAAKQSWWDNKGTFYTQDNDGGYFLYNMACTEEEYNTLVPGTKIKVTGYKSEWAGEVEITDATWEIVDAGFTYIPGTVDVTAKLGTDELINYQNMKVEFNGLTIAASQDADGNDVAFLYKYDGSGSHDANSDLYFNVTDGTNTYTFTVESYLCDNTTDVYKAVENLQIGQKVNLEGFLYWYNGVNPHITSVENAD